jgi:hypothetical protein
MWRRWCESQNKGDLVEVENAVEKQQLLKYPS